MDKERFESVVGEIAEDLELAAWVAKMMAREDGRERLRQTRAESELDERLLAVANKGFTVAASRTDAVSLLQATAFQNLKQALADPGSVGLPADAIYVGCYRPAPAANSARVVFYAVGVNIVLTFVYGKFQLIQSELDAAANRLQRKNQVNFVPAGSARSDRVFVHSELNSHSPISRAEAAEVASALAAWPIEFARLLVDREYEYVESADPPEEWPSQLATGSAALAISSGATRPALGFVLQLPPVGNNKPVCVLGPCRNENPTRDPVGNATIYMTPEQLLVKMY